MTVALIALLILSAAFNVVTWPTFLRRVARDPRARDETGAATAFLRVHVILVAIALALAAASVAAAVALIVAAL